MLTPGFVANAGRRRAPSMMAASVPQQHYQHQEQPAADAVPIAADAHGSSQPSASTFQAPALQVSPCPSFAAAEVISMFILRSMITSLQRNTTSDAG